MAAGLEAGSLRRSRNLFRRCLYFLNEADIVIYSDEATFFDSHVSRGFVCAATRRLVDQPRDVCAP